MTPLFKKLNFKHHQQILLLNHPAEFKAEMEAMKDYSAIETDFGNLNEIEFVLSFVKTKSEIDTITERIGPKLKGDAVVWFAYPKGSSRKYSAEINRDNGWEMLGKTGLEAVRQVAIDEDWSALRFRKVEFIKTMKRKTDSAMTIKGKQKTKKSNRR
jgi:hypothetical protein